MWTSCFEMLQACKWQINYHMPASDLVSSISSNSSWKFLLSSVYKQRSYIKWFPCYFFLTLCNFHGALSVLVNQEESYDLFSHWGLEVYITSPIKLRYTLNYVDTKMTDFIFSLSSLLIKHETMQLTHNL